MTHAVYFGGLPLAATALRARSTSCARARAASGARGFGRPA